MCAGRPRLADAAGACVALLLLAGCTAGRASRDDSVRIVYSSVPITFDPHLHDELTTASTLSHIYDGLTAFDGDMRVRPALAERWDNPDDLTWRFHLRRGVRFHDGRPLTAADVAFSLERVRTHPRSRTGGYLVRVQSVRVIDSLTVEIRTVVPFPVLPNRLPYVLIVPRNAPDEIRQPIGTGPYRVVAWDSAAHRLSLAAWDGYWGPRPAVAHVELSYVEDGAVRLRLLLHDSADVLSQIRIDRTDSVRHAPCCELLTRSSLAVAYLGLNMRTAPFSDVRVRRAISLAIDRQWVVDSVLRGLGRPAGQIVSPQVFGFATDVASPARNVAEARRLLAAAGFAHGFAMTILHARIRTLEVEAIARQLADVGIRVTAKSMPFDSVYVIVQRGDAGAWLASVAALSGDASDTYDSYLHSSDKARGYGEANATGFADPQLDSLIELGGRLTVPAARGPVFAAADRRVATELPLIPLWIAHRLFAERKGLAWQPRLDGRVLAQEMRWR